VPVVAVPMERGRQYRCSRCHPHRVGNTLAQRAGGGFYTRGVTALRVTRSLGVKLTEALELVHRKVVTGQVQQRINQHRAVAVGQHKTVAIYPDRKSVVEGKGVE